MMTLSQLLLLFKAKSCSTPKTRSKWSPSRIVVAVPKVPAMPGMWTGGGGSGATRAYRKVQSDIGVYFRKFSHAVFDIVIGKRQERS